MGKQPIVVNNYRWDEDIQHVSSFEGLPKTAQTYITTIEKELGVPISWVGTGPKREEMFKKKIA